MGPGEKILHALHAKSFATNLVGVVTELTEMYNVFNTHFLHFFDRDWKRRRLKVKGLCTVVTCQPCVNCTNGNSKFLPGKVGGLGIDIGARVASPNKQPMVAGLLVIK